MGCRKKDAINEILGTTKSDIVLEEMQYDFFPGFAAPIHETPYQGKLPDYRCRSDDSAYCIKKVGLKKEIVNNIISLSIILAVFSGAIYIDLNVRSYYAKREKEKVVQIDKQFEAYQSLYGHEVPLKARIQRDIFAITYDYKEKSPFASDQAYRALQDVQGYLKKILPTNQKKWTAEQKEANEWMEQAVKKYCSNNLVYRNSFLEDIFNNIVSSEFLSQPVTRHNIPVILKKNEQKIHS